MPTSVTELSTHTLPTTVAELSTQTLPTTVAELSTQPLNSFSTAQPTSPPIQAQIQTPVNVTNFTLPSSQQDHFSSSAISSPSHDGVSHDGAKCAATVDLSAQTLPSSQLHSQPTASQPSSPAPTAIALSSSPLSNYTLPSSVQDEAMSVDRTVAERIAANWMQGLSIDESSARVYAVRIAEQGYSNPAFLSSMTVQQLTSMFGIASDHATLIADQFKLVAAEMGAITDTGMSVEEDSDAGDNSPEASNTNAALASDQEWLEQELLKQGAFGSSGSGSLVSDSEGTSVTSAAKDAEIPTEAEWLHSPVATAAAATRGPGSFLDSLHSFESATADSVQQAAQDAATALGTSTRPASGARRAASITSEASAPMSELEQYSLPSSLTSSRSSCHDSSVGPEDTVEQEARQQLLQMQQEEALQASRRFATANAAVAAEAEALDAEAGGVASPSMRATAAAPVRHVVLARTKPSSPASDPRRRRVRALKSVGVNSPAQNSPGTPASLTGGATPRPQVSAKPSLKMRPAVGAKKSPAASPRVRTQTPLRTRQSRSGLR